MKAEYKYNHWKMKTEKLKNGKAIKMKTATALGTFKVLEGTVQMLSFQTCLKDW